LFSETVLFLSKDRSTTASKEEREGIKQGIHTHLKTTLHWSPPKKKVTVLAALAMQKLCFPSKLEEGKKWGHRRRTTTRLVINKVRALIATTTR